MWHAERPPSCLSHKTKQGNYDRVIKYGHSYINPIAKIAGSILKLRVGRVAKPIGLLTNARQ
jgi:hypothetical protein